jgi:hypothetical protein
VVRSPSFIRPVVSFGGGPVIGALLPCWAIAFGRPIAEPSPGGISGAEEKAIESRFRP